MVMTAYYDDDRYYYLPAIKVVHVHVCCSLHALAWPGSENMSDP